MLANGGVPLVTLMEDVIVYELRALGFGPFFEQQIQAPGEGETIPARVAAGHRGAYEVWSTTGVGRAQLTGRLRLEADTAGAPAVGDWVVVRDAPRPESTTVIERVLGRRTAFTRGVAGRQARAQVVAANVDLVFVVTGLDLDFSVRRIERYVARIWASGAQPAVILNKADVCAECVARVAEVEKHCAGVAVHVTSAFHSQGIESVRASIRHGMTVALVGSSGVGKSTLVNALLGEERLRTGPVRASDGRGCHVTTRRELFLLPGGGLLLDTPGMRELQLPDEDGLDAVFGDIAAIGERCRYRDCRHGTEPGCAVRAAVASGELDAARFEHHQQLEREAQAYELRHDARKRKQAARRWGRVHEEANLQRKWKGGKP